MFQFTISSLNDYKRSKSFHKMGVGKFLLLGCNRVTISLSIYIVRIGYNTILGDKIQKKVRNEPK